MAEFINYDLLPGIRERFFPTPAEPQVPAKPEYIKSTDTLLDHVRAHDTQMLDQELKKEKPRFDKVLELAIRVIACTMRDQSRINQHYIFENGLEIQVHAHEVKGTFGPYSVVAITVASSLIGVAAGVGGLTPLAPAWVSPEIAKTLSQAAQPIGTASTSIQSIGQTFGESYQGKRTIYQVLLDNAKDSRSQEQDRMRESNQLKSSCCESLKEMIRSVTQAISTILQ